MALSRRQLIGSASIAAATASLPACASHAPAAALSDPAIDLARRYYAALRVFNTLPDSASADEETRAFDDLSAAAAACYSTAPATPAGALALVGAIREREFGCINDEAFRGDHDPLCRHPPDCRVMSPARISSRRGRARPSRSTFSIKPVTLPTFSFYGHLPVVFVDGELVIGRRVIPRPGVRP